MEALKNVGWGLLGIAIIVALVFVAALLINGIAWVSGHVLEYLITFNNIVTVMCIVFLLPLALFRKTRVVPAYGLHVASFVFGDGLFPGPALALGNAADAEACFQGALAVACQQQAKSWELRAAMSLARLWHSQGKPQQGRELLAPIYGWFTEGFDTRDLKEAKVLLEELAP